MRSRRCVRCCGTRVRFEGAVWCRLMGWWGCVPAAARLNDGLASPEETVNDAGLDAEWGCGVRALRVVGVRTSRRSSERRLGVSKGDCEGAGLDGGWGFDGVSSEPRRRQRHVGLDENAGCMSMPGSCPSPFGGPTARATPFRPSQTLHTTTPQPHSASNPAPSQSPLETPSRRSDERRLVRTSTTS